MCAALCEHLHRRGVDVDVEIEGTCAERYPHRLHGREQGAEQDVSRACAVHRQGAGGDVIADPGAFGAVGRATHGDAETFRRSVGELGVDAVGAGADRKPHAAASDGDAVAGVCLSSSGGEWTSDAGDQCGFPVDGTQSQLTRQGHRSAPPAGRRLLSVEPVAHPPQHDPFAGRGVIEGDAGVEVSALVDELRWAVGGESLAVEISDEIAGAGALEQFRRYVRGGWEYVDGRRVVADHQNPLDSIRIAVHRQREQVGALPDAAVVAPGAELAERAPLLQVVRAIQHHLTVECFDGHHHPIAFRRAVVVPEHLGIAEVRGPAVHDRVAAELAPRRCAVGAVGQRLGLAPAPVLGGVDRHHRRVVGGTEAGGVVVVDHG